MNRPVYEIEDDLDELQIAYINQDDEVEQLEIVRKFTSLLKEATDTDQVDRIAAGMNINNWSRGTTREA